MRTYYLTSFLRLTKQKYYDDNFVKRSILNRDNCRKKIDDSSTGINVWVHLKLYYNL